RLSYGLGSTLSTFASGLSLENVTFDLSGDAYATFDDGTNTVGGIQIVNRLAKSRTAGTLSQSRDRAITGANTGLKAPKGIEVADSLGWAMIAENDAAAASIRVFSTCATGNVAPLGITDLTTVGRPWDLDYDPGSDRLFVALVNGKVAVYDQYSLDFGAG